MRGRFITLEGIEGVGKSTQTGYVAGVLRDRGRDVIVTREPGGTALGEAIRSIVLDHRHTGMSEDAELLLMFAARAEHLDKVIRPALAAGRDVVCDRFTDATYAYQGAGRGVAVSRIGALEELVQAGLQPDLTLLLDAPVALALGRSQRRGQGDRFEAETVAFFERVRNCYLQRAGAAPQRFRVIDASPGVEDVQRQIATQLETRES